MFKPEIVSLNVTKVQKADLYFQHKRKCLGLSQVPRKAAITNWPDGNKTFNTGIADRSNMLSSRSSKIRYAISRAASIVIVVVIIIIIAAGGIYAVTLPKKTTTTTVPPTTTTVPTTTTTSVPPTTTTTSVPPTTTTVPTTITTSTTSVSVAAPKNSSELVDDSPGLTATSAYDSLDPAEGFFVTDGYFANVFQGLVQYSPTNGTAVVPSLASNWTVSSNFEHFTFTMRPNTWFSNKDPINAYVAWFSFERELYVNNPDGVGISNYAGLTVNTSDPLEETPQGNQFPNGLQNALGAAHLCTVSATDDSGCVAALNYMLSNFNPNNSTQQAVMSYANQAYVAVSSSTFQINLIQPYRLFLTALPPQWGAIVDPTFIDANDGGVLNDTTPTNSSTNGMVGSGPYMYGTHSAGNTELVLNKNPNYWGIGVSGLAANLQPAKIASIEMQFGDQPQTQIAGFASNNAQIISLLPSLFGELWSSYHSSYPSVAFSDVFENAGYPLCDLANEINTQIYPTNITLLRQAIVHSVNYSSIQQQLYSYNGTSLGELFIPPVPPGWGVLDNPQSIPLYSYNITLAQQLIAQAGSQNSFYVTLPNGTKVGDTSGTALAPIEYAYLTPSTPATETLIAILSAGLSNIGVTITPTAITESTYEADTAQASTTPTITGVGWCADFPDPIYQQFYDQATTVTHQANWVNNATLNTLMAEIPFETNSTLQLQQTVQAYNIFTQLATIIQMPNAASVFFHQPYVQGIVYSPFEFAIYYDMMSYSS